MQNSFDVENGMLREPVTLRKKRRRNEDEGTQYCYYCDQRKPDDAMSVVDEMCSTCHSSKLKTLQRIVDALDDEALIVVFNHLTEV